MAKIVMEEQPEWDVLPKDTVIKVKVEDTRIDDLEGKYGPWQKISVKFLIEEIPSGIGDYSALIGQQIWGSVPFKLNDSPDNQLRQWVEALLGIQLSVGFNLDTDELIGRRARAVVDNYENKNGQTRHQVGSLLPLTGQDAVADREAQAAAQASIDAWTAPAQQPASVGASSSSQEEEIPF